MNRMLKQTLALVLVFALVLGFVPQNIFSFGSQTALASPPSGYTAITTAAELQAIGATPSSRNGNYWLANDINIIPQTSQEVNP